MVEATGVPIDVVRALPKLDLHCHLDGAARTGTLLELGREAGIALPAETVEGLARHVQVSPSCRSLREFLLTFESFYPVLESPGAMERLARELIEDVAADGVVHVEVRFCPALQARPGHGPELVLEEILAGLRAGVAALESASAAGSQVPSWGAIICCYRSLQREQNEKLIDLALAYREQGVVAVDLAGPEHIAGAALAPALRRAREGGLAVTIHAGEAEGPPSLREALFVLGAQRLGHGVRLAEDPALVEHVREHAIPLECCLTSNLATGLVQSLAQHPFEALRQAGCLVTLNTDDPAVCVTNLSAEFEAASRTWGYDLDALRGLSRNAVEAAFTPEANKRRLRELLD